MHDIGSCQIGVEFEFLNMILTDRGILEGTLNLNQSLEVKDVTYMPENKFLVFDCNVLESLLN